MQADSLIISYTSDIILGVLGFWFFIIFSSLRSRYYLDALFDTQARLMSRWKVVQAAADPVVMNESAPF